MKKKLSTLAAIVFGAALMSGPAMASETEPAPVDAVDCGAEALQDRLGEAVSGTSADDVTVGGEPVEAAGVVRVVGPGDAVTMDFVAERLTLETDEDGNLVRAQCG